MCQVSQSNHHLTSLLITQLVNHHANQLANQPAFSLTFIHFII